MDDQFITIKEVAINNNCPECYNTNGLQLTFKQKFKDTRFYKTLTSETAHQLFCKTCETAIYPINWTDDIDRVFDYHQRAFEPKKASLKLKRSAYIAIGTLVGIIVIAIAVTIYLTNL
ncbi:hypothetical protein BZARG_525 [Bizionia argentinensis JUB59]|uniref:Uncharacterized protein n=1 Tax=Bizionia argentinensis JUB59 TaxID=1046627 RepID=G2EHD9_9FLAO|nr:hypothetical protein [Bizionia argentinensis]EGV42158.1 hypothetical protein BZARG_525 [Bizionia argentinensis JUB59]